MNSAIDITQTCRHLDKNTYKINILLCEKNIFLKYNIKKSFILVGTLFSKINIYLSIIHEYEHDYTSFLFLTRSFNK